MRIAIVCTLYPPYILGGAEKSTALLAEGLLEQGHDVFVITTGKEDEQVNLNGINVYRLKNRNIYWRYPQRDKPLLKKAIWHLLDIYNVFYEDSLKRIFTLIRPDIVHTGNLCGLSCCVWNIAKSMGIPIVHTLRDYYLLCPQQTMLKGNKSCDTQCFVCKEYSLVKKVMSEKVDAVVGISNFILSLHKKYGYFKNAKYNCVIPNSVKYGNVANLGGKNKDIGYIGRLSPEKGIEFMIEAFKMSQNKNNVKLKIAGTGNKKYEDYLKQKYNDKNIIFLGQCDQSDFFNTISLLVVPSLWNEPFGRVVIEAYSCHIPVFMADNGGLSELVENGISRVFSTDSPNKLTILLNKYFQKDIIFDCNLFECAAKKYSQHIITEKYVDLYDKTIKKRYANEKKFNY